MRPKKLPEGTTKEDWDKYEIDFNNFVDRMEKEKPLKQNFTDPDVFNNAMHEWSMAVSCDAPNKPGYYRANND